MKYKYTKFSFLIFLCQAFQIAIAINKYKVIHTGPKIQSGGLKNGLFRFEYHGSFDEKVTILPINDAEKVVTTKTKKDIILFFNILVIYINS